MSLVSGIFSSSSSAAGHLAELADSVADFAERSGGVARMRRLRETGREYDSTIWKQMAELGWLGILVPEEFGGLGLGLSEMAVVAEGLARTLAPEPLNAVAVLATGVLVASGNEALKREMLPRIVAGEIKPVLAWQETAGNLDPDAVRTQAVPFEGGYKLGGEKKYIAGARHADAFLVSASTNSGIALFWLPRQTAGATIVTDAVADGTSFGTLTLKDAQLAAAHCVAQGDAARDVLARALDHAAAIAGAELSGVMNRALNMSLDFLRTRVQFGKPIGSFQALQHRTVDLYIRTQLAGAVLEEALPALMRNPDARTRATLASRVKARCSDAALRVTRETIQLHGAMGFTDECDAGLYLKRALVLAAWLGNAAHHRRRYAELTAGERA